MKKKMRSMRVFYQYLMSHCGIALLFCAMIGVSLFNYFVTEYGNRVYAGEVQKSEAVLSDLEAQIGLMERISYGVSHDLGYSYAELRSSNYAEFAMLQEFVRYSANNMFSKTYFLLFQGERRVYYSSNYGNNGNGAAYDVFLFLDAVLNVAEPTSLYETLCEMTHQTILPLAENGMMLFCFPLRIRSSSVNSVLCFCVTQAQIQERAQLVSGGTDSFLIRSGDTALFRQEEPEPHARGTRLLQMDSSDGRLSLEKYVDVSMYMRDLLSYRKLLIYAVLFCVLLLSATAIISHQHSKPIQRIDMLMQTGQSGSGKTSINNELMDIEYQLHNMLETDVEHRQRLNRQMRLLREQTLRLLLCGEYSDVLCDMLSQMDISFENRYVGAAVVHIPGEKPASPFIQTLMDQIEDLSTEEMRFYCCPDNQRGDVDLLLSLEKCPDNGPLDAMEMVQDLLDAENTRASMGCGSLYSDARKLAASRAEARDSLAQGQDAAMTFAATRHCFERILGCVRMGDAEEAIRLLDAYVQESETTSESLMRQRCVLIDLLNMLVSAAQEMGIEIYSRQISVVMTGQNLKSILEGIRDLIFFICERVDRESSGDEKLIHKVMEYIRNHCLENDLSLDRISAEFNITSSYLSRLVRTSVGCGYKDYVLRLRMEQACIFLKQGMSTTDTCRECGYVNISHFIKTFKQFTGMTPSSYQRDAQSSMQA